MILLQIHGRGPTFLPGGEEEEKRDLGDTGQTVDIYRPYMTDVQYTHCSIILHIKFCVHCTVNSDKNITPHQ